MELDTGPSVSFFSLSELGLLFGLHPGSLFVTVATILSYPPLTIGALSYLFG